MVHPGEEKAWELLSKLDPKDTETRTGATFNSDSSTYELKCFGQDIHVSLKEREITTSSPIGELIVSKLGEYSRLSILSYLVTAKDIPLSGELVRPADLPGGGIFGQGTHVLPMDKVAKKFGRNHKQFLSVGKELGASVLDHGNVSLELLPFPRVPVTLIAWTGDKEFPPTAFLLCDSTCTAHLPIDILWSTAMMTVRIVQKCNSSIVRARHAVPLHQFSEIMNGYELITRLGLCL